MQYSEYSGVLEQLPIKRGAPRGYGQPFETADGVTVIPVERPLGVFVVHAGQASWVPAVDKNRVALLGALTGLLTGVIACLAVLRQPPWPRITIRDYR
ncbi:hypothetical protein [Mycobacterium sherrisii]|uniref:hypothetical protein n=1 Tax=Mycobacterium sherrisii TaxID=243061 RepID=UPI000A15C572|nr:hypothetical protein [Mycobacterium sherrisii]MCV7028412.1 hypothetical protein [Mycobacterium sherrisii]ORW76192.1 hypothetical protein AWC25_11885 [Mycobacterium sherrisii]